MTYWYTVLTIDNGPLSITSSNVQSNTTCLTDISIDLGLHVLIHYGIIIRPSLKYTDTLHKTIKTRFGIPIVRQVVFD